LFLARQDILLPQVPSVRALVSRYVGAVQNRDYKTIVELNQEIRLNESMIKSENPKLLWPKLIAEYRHRRIRQLNGEEKQI